MSGAALGDFQLGKITIDSNAKVTIKSNSTTTTVEADISVTTENGSIDISDSKLTGKKDVTVSTNKESTDTVIKANTNLNAPIQFSDIEIMSYTLSDLKALRDGNIDKINGSNLKRNSISSCTDKELQEIVNYFNAFGSKLQAFGKAKVSGTTKGGNAVTITIPAKSELTLADIGGLK